MTLNCHDIDLTLAEFLAFLPHLTTAAILAMPIPRRRQPMSERLRRRIHADRAADRRRGHRHHRGDRDPGIAARADRRQRSLGDRQPARRQQLAAGLHVVVRQRLLCVDARRSSATRRRPARDSSAPIWPRRSPSRRAAISLDDGRRQRGDQRHPGWLQPERHGRQSLQLVLRIQPAVSAGLTGTRWFWTNSLGTIYCRPRTISMPRTSATRRRRVGARPFE